MISQLAPEWIFCIEIFKCCVCAVMYLLLSALVGKSVGFSSEFTGVEDITARRVLLLIAEGVSSIVQSVVRFWIIADCTPYPVKVLHAYSRSTGFIRDAPAAILTTLQLESLALYLFALFVIRSELQMGPSSTVRSRKFP